MVETVSSFIDAKGGNAVVAKATGHSEGAVAQWRHRDRIPRTAWPELMTAFDDVGLRRLMIIEAGQDDASPVDAGTLAPGEGAGAGKSVAGFSPSGAAA